MDRAFAALADPVRRTIVAQPSEDSPDLQYFHVNDWTYVVTEGDLTADSAREIIRKASVLRPGPGDPFSNVGVFVHKDATSTREGKRVLESEGLLVLPYSR